MDRETIHIRLVVVVVNMHTARYSIHIYICIVFSKKRKKTHHQTQMDHKRTTKVCSLKLNFSFQKREKCFVFFIAPSFSSLTLASPGRVRREVGNIGGLYLTRSYPAATDSQRDQKYFPVLLKKCFIACKQHAVQSNAIRLHSFFFFFFLHLF